MGHRKCNVIQHVSYLHLNFHTRIFIVFVINKPFINIQSTFMTKLTLQTSTIVNSKHVPTDAYIVTYKLYVCITHRL